MRIFFTTPYDETKKYQNYVDTILGVLHKNNATVISPEEQKPYVDSIKDYESKGLQPERAHYAFITQGIAEADLVIFEATNEDIRVGHEVTLALLYGKPTLVVSQSQNFSKYIPHELLHGGQYSSSRQLTELVQEFIDNAEKNLKLVTTSAQAIENAADSLHIAALATTRQSALKDTGEFGQWARLAEKNPEKAYKIILDSIGNLPVGKPWSAFAQVYNEDSPDFIQTGVARFVDMILRRHHIKKSDLVVEAATGTGALLRVMAGLGYRNLAGFDNSRQMMAEAFRLCAHMPDIQLFEADIDDVQLPQKAKAILWTDYSSNFALTPKALTHMLQNLMANVADQGSVIFDIRSLHGWQVSFYRQKVTTFATNNFQRIWINLPDYKKRLITFDIFLRRKLPDGGWSSWEREQMTERMWMLDEVKTVVEGLNSVELEGIYADDFAPLKDTNHEPGLAYIVLNKL